MVQKAADLLDACRAILIECSDEIIFRQPYCRLVAAQVENSLCLSLVESAGWGNR